jgi:hypothetical protein
MSKLKALIGATLAYKENEMAKANSVVNQPHTSDEPVNLKDLGYKVAKTGDGLKTLGAWAVAHIKGFPKDVSKEDEQAIKEGMRLRYSELKPTVEYGVVEGKYILLSELASKPKEVVKVGVEYAYSYTQQAFGKLKSDNPELHAIVKEWRNKTSDYVGNAYRTLVANATEKKKRERGASKDFDEFVLAWFDDTAKTRLVSAKARGDLTADDKLFSKAKVAFMTVWKHTSKE